MYANNKKNIITHLKFIALQSCS